MSSPSVITDYKAAMSVLADRTMRQALYDEGGVVMKDVLLTLHGEQHRQRRILEFKVFRKDFFAHYESNVFPSALGETLKPYLKRGCMDLVDFGYRVTMNLTADFAGVDRTSRTQTETEELLRLVKAFSHAATIAHSKLNKADVLRDAQEALDVLEEKYVVPSIKRRKALLARLDEGEVLESELPRDVLTVLLRNEDKLSLPDSVILREMAFYLQAGSHSTANSTIHALNEIFEFCDHHPHEWAHIRTDDLFLQRCVHESLRLHPASPVAWRTKESGCPVHNESPAQTERYVVDISVANRQQDIFGLDANEFNPYRRLPTEIPPWGLTFGYGLHMCLGRDLDGGLASNSNTNPETHQYGIVTRLIRALIDSDVRRDPSDPATPDHESERPNFGRYPVLFNIPTEVCA